MESSPLENVRDKLSSDDNKVLIAVDLNGVDGSDTTVARSALIPALSEIDVLHLNEDDASSFLHNYLNTRALLSHLYSSPALKS